MTMQAMIVILLSVLALVASTCDNSCSGHGTCQGNGVCECYEGWGLGLSLDSGDCSQRICPFESAWVDSPDRLGNHHKYVECSAKGICNRDTGECECFPGYEGKGCARTTCPNDCSGHGQCLYLDKEPFKTVIGDYNNYKKYVTFEERSVSAVGNTFTSSPSFVANLLPNSKVGLDGSIYFVKSVDSSSTFKLGSTVDAATAYSSPILSSIDVTADGTTANLFTAVGAALTTDFFVNKEVIIGGVTYFVETVPSTTTFTVSQTSGGAVYNAPLNLNTFGTVSATSNIVTGTSAFVATLQLNDPLTIDDTDYYVLAKPAATTFTVKETLAGTIATLSDGTGLAAVRKLSASTYIGGVTAVASTGIFTGTTAFVANLVIGNPVVINNAQYWVRSKPSATTFTVATNGPTLYKPTADVTDDAAATTTRIVTVKVTQAAGVVTAPSAFVTSLTVNDAIYIDGMTYLVESKSGATFKVKDTSAGAAITTALFTGTVEASISLSTGSVGNAVTEISAATGIHTGLSTFVSELVVGNTVTIGSNAFTVRSIESTTTFTVNDVGTAVYKPAADITTAVVARLISTGTALAPVDARSFVIVRGTGSNTLLSSKLPHGLVVGDYVYFTGLVGTNAQQTATQIFNNVFYKVSAITDPYQFAVRKVSGSITSSTTLLSALFAGASTVVTCNVIKIKDIAQGQFDVVDPFIDSLTLYIDRKYWDAKKTRACLCDPEYGDVDCSARMCQYGTDIMDARKDETVVAKNHIQLVSFTGVGSSGESTYKPAFMGASKGKTFALTFRTKLNETFSTIPINMPFLDTTTGVAAALAAIRNFELDVEWALKILPNSVIDGAKVKVTKPVDTTGIIPTNGVYPVTIPLLATNVAATGQGSIGGTTAGSNVFEFSVEFSGNNVQGTQHYLTVEAAKCGNGCFPKIDGLPISSEIGGNTFITVITKPTFSAGADNDYESDFNSYECGRRGKCDYKTGLCSCFSGYTGGSCNIITALV